MRKISRAPSIAVLALAALGLTGCASNSTAPVATHQACSDIAAPLDCAPHKSTLLANDVSAFGAVSSAPEVLAAEARRNAAAEEIEKALAARGLSAGIRAGVGVETERDIAYASHRTGGAYSYALSLDIPIYQGGADAAIATARAEFRAADEVAGDQRVAVAYEMATSLLRIRQQREIVASLERQQSALQALRSDINAELAAGAASRVDLDDTDRQLARIAVTRETAKLSLTEASSALVRLGVPAASKLPDIGKLRLGENPDALIDLALRHNPRVRQRSALLDAAASRVDQAQGALRPSVSTHLEVFGEDADASGIALDHGARAEVRVSLPFDLSGAGAAEVRQRSDELLAAQFDGDAARDGVAAAVRTAFERRLQARRLMGLAKSEVDSAQAMLSGVQAERQVGERTAYDEIRAIENLTGAEINLISARFELQSAEYTLAAETGLIADLFDIPVHAAALTN